MNVIRRVAAMLAALAIAGGSAACGYALVGRGNTLPATVRTIGVPQFENRSPTPEIDVFITDETRREFQGRGSLRTIPTEEGSDAVLKGIIHAVDVQPSAVTADRIATSYVIIVRASVELKETRAGGDVLWANPSMVYREDYNIPAGQVTGDPSLAFRQDTNALQRLARNFARSLVLQVMSGD
jgi:hypothetical protein